MLCTSGSSANARDWSQIMGGEAVRTMRFCST